MHPRSPTPLHRLAAVTVDLHLGDGADDIRFACEHLQSLGIRATFFVPSAMINERRYGAVLRTIPSYGHELGSHSHLHDRAEMRALMDGKERDLTFLRISKAIHEAAFGSAPTAFRSPAWCHLGRAAVDVLVELGYRVDSSSTPQRLGVFSSLPFENVWTFAPRRLTYLAPTVLEVPTSTFLMPAGTPSFSILPAVASRLFVQLLKIESQLLRNRVLCLQFHPHSFNPSSTHRHWKPTKVSVRSFLPTRDGGLMFKHFLRRNNPKATAASTDGVLRLLRAHRCLAMSEIGTAVRSAAGGELPSRPT